jgi:ankyrin repeat protein
MASSNYDRDQRLAEFARELHLNPDRRPVRQQIPGRPVRFRDAGDEQAAQQLLQASKHTKIESVSFVKRKLMSKAKRTTFSHSEILAELVLAVKANIRPGLVEVLGDLVKEQNGDINFSRMKSQSLNKKIRGKNQTEERSKLLEMATANRNIDMVQVLAPFSDQTSLDESLHIALNVLPDPRSIIIPEILLAYGADATDQDVSFTAAIESRNSDLVSLLLNAPKPVSHEWVSGSLELAVKLDLPDILFLLVQAGADGNGADGSGSALKTAIRAGRKDQLVGITLCEKKPTPQTLDHCVVIAFSENIPVGLQDRMDLMEILLSNGARGPGSAATLVKITQLMVAKPEPTLEPVLRNMMELLIRFETSIDFENAAALKLCVSKTRIDLLDILLRTTNLDPNLASAAFSMIDSNTTPPEKVEIGSRLLARGAYGVPLHEALITAANMDHIEGVEMLVLREGSNKASVDYRNAQALQDAVSREKLQIVDIMLTAAPSVESLGVAFPHIRKVSKEGRFYLTETFLFRGAQGPAVHQALDAAISDNTPLRDERLIQLLVEKGAEVDPHLEAAVCQGDENLVRMLLIGGPSVQVLSQSLILSLELQDASKRVLIVKQLLDAGADVNYDNGLVILRATQDKFGESLELLLHFCPVPLSLEAAFSSATAMKDPGQRYSFCQKLLNAGATGTVVNKALIVAVQQQPQNTEFLRLVMPSASVDYDGGHALCVAIKNMLREHVLLLLNMKPSEATFQNSFAAAMDLGTEKMQAEYCKMLLQARPQGNSVSTALVKSVERQNESISELLLQNGASVDFDSGSSVMAALRYKNAKILKLLVGDRDRKPSITTLTSAFEAILATVDASQNQELLRIILDAGVRRNSLDIALLSLVKELSQDVDTMNTLLQYGASPHCNANEGLLLAAKSSNIVILLLLLKHVTDVSAVSLVFADRFQDGAYWATQPGFKVMRTLLMNGARGDSVNEALVMAVSQFRSKRRAQEFVPILLENGADVNFKDGYPLQIAATMGDVQLIQDMLVRDCNSHCLALAFPYIFHSKVDESTMVAIVNKFRCHPNQRFEEQFLHPNVPQPVVLLSIMSFPQSLNILASILGAGFPVDEKRGCEMTSGNTTILTTPLFWALSQPGEFVHDSLIVHLMQCGATIHGHPEPLLHMAIRDRRPLIVKCLVDARADLDLPDDRGRTPLAHATEIGDVASMSVLLQAGAELDDDSLHIAARMLHTDAMNLLMDNGHDPNKPSTKLQGRSPLAELCLTAPSHAQLSSEKKLEQDLKRAIQTLIIRGARMNFQLKPSGKSVLIHALDSDNAYVAAKALLDCGQFHHINDDFNLFNDGEYTYSPTKYVEKGLCQGSGSDSSQRQRIIDLLVYYQAEHRYWRNEGEQPQDMVNPPGNILKAELQRREVENERKQQIEAVRFRAALQEEEVQQNLRLQEQKFQFEQAQIEARHRAQLQHKNEISEFEFASKERAARLKQGVLEAESKTKLDYGHQFNIQALHYQDAVYARRDREIKLENRGKENELSIQQRSTAAQKSLLDKQIALGQETRRVAATAIEYGGWQNGGFGMGTGPRPALGNRRAISYNQLANMSPGRITEL